MVYTTYYQVVHGFVYSQKIFEQNTQEAGSVVCLQGEELEAQGLAENKALSLDFY